MSNPSTLETIPAPPVPFDEARRDAFVERTLASARGVFDALGAYLGVRLGLYDALAAAEEGSTSGELAERAGVAERYAREWLEQQAVSGVLEVDDPAAAPGARRFRLPPEHAEPLTDRDSPSYVAPLPLLLAGAARPLDALLEAYRTGGGVPFADYGADVREGQAAMNRPTFLRQLGPEWIAAMPDVDARLRAGGRVADVGCGAGWSSIGAALAYPGVRVDGFDLDAPSIEMARENADEHGVADRVRFHVEDAGALTRHGAYDLVMAMECVHDLSDPVSALCTMRRLAAPDGAVLVVDERVAERFDPDDEGVDWMMYGWSILHCLPVGMAEQPSACTGTVMRPDVLRRYAREAGFRSVEVLPVEHPFFRLYRLHL